MTTMEKVYLLAQEHCGLKVGDYVRVTRKAENHEAGWGYFWTIGANEAVGNIYRITCITQRGIFLENHEGYTFPYFVLEKVEKPEHEFKPFDKVLVRDSDADIWRPDIFSMYETDAVKSLLHEPGRTFQCLGDCWMQCIPYEGNQHLAGTKEAAE